LVRSTRGHEMLGEGTRRTDGGRSTVVVLA
jgi:hypothetical protein